MTVEIKKKARIQSYGAESSAFVAHALDDLLADFARMLQTGCGIA